MSVTYYGLDHSSLISATVADRILEIDEMEDGARGTLYVVASSFGNIGLALREDEADRRAMQPLFDDSELWP